VRSPIADLIVGFRKKKDFPAEWVRGFSPSGDIDEAIRNAWAAENYAEWLAWIARRLGDRPTFSAIARDIGASFLRFFPESDPRAREVLEFIDEWLKDPKKPYPKRWRDLYRALEPDDTKVDDQDVAGNVARASYVMRFVLRVPAREATIVDLVEQAVSNLVVERCQRFLDEGGDEKAWTDDKIEDVHAEVSPPLLAAIRKHLPAPNATRLRDALLARSRKK
jgi:hypothetical protein